MKAYLLIGVFLASLGATSVGVAKLLPAAEPKPEPRVLSTAVSLSMDTNPTPTPSITSTPTPQPTQTPTPSPTNTPTPNPTPKPQPTTTATPTPTPTRHPTPTHINFTPTPTVTPTRTPTPTVKTQITPASSEQAYQWIEQYAVEYKVDPNVIRFIAICETGFNSQAKNGPYWGMFQYSSSTWSGYRKQMGEDPNPDLRLDAQAAVKTTAYILSRGGQRNWPNCYPK